MYLGEAGDGPGVVYLTQLSDGTWAYTFADGSYVQVSSPKQFTQAEIDNWIAYQGAQPIDPFLTGRTGLVSDLWKDRPRQEVVAQAIRDLDLNEIRKNAGMGPAPWENPNWPAITAAKAAAAEAERTRVANTPSPFTIGPGPNTTPGTVTVRPGATSTPVTPAVPATRDQVVNAFRNTPGANPQPDEAAISYYMSKGIAQLVIDVAAIRKANPALAAQIDAQRRAMGLTTTTTTTVTTPSTTAKGGGTMALLLAAAAVYFLGS